MSQATTEIVLHSQTVGKLASSDDAVDSFAEKMSAFFKLSTCIVKGGFAPRGLDTVEKLTAAMAFGDELGFKPMSSIRVIGVVGGKPGLYADGILAVVQRSGLLVLHQEHFDGDGETCTAVCIMQRRGMQPCESRYGVVQAKRAGLWGKLTSSGAATPWVTNPKDMMMWKARHRAVKASFSDLLMGVDAVEDLREIEPGGRVQSVPVIASGEPHTQADKLNADLMGDAPTESAGPAGATEITSEEKEAIIAQEAAEAAGSNNGF